MFNYIEEVSSSHFFRRNICQFKDSVLYFYLALSECLSNKIHNFLTSPFIGDKKLLNFENLEL